ncbi:hypothetical protein JTB14_035550 [Gonioctena quinquepunctata]|nr:hypothetical protein JTB14_035550 [Gonioctena quinquepunctata]
MSLMRYDFEIPYTTCRNLYIADVLSRKPTQSEDDGELGEVGAFNLEVSLASIDTTDGNFIRIAISQLRDPICKKIKQMIDADGLQSRNFLKTGQSLRYWRDSSRRNRKILQRYSQ